MRWWLAVFLCSCVDSNSIICSDGQLCPGNTVCTPLTHIANDPNAELCADPDAIKACNGKQEGDVCDTGVCHDGVCLPISCGNGYVDPGEACDDHNNNSGDGCSADCKSTEVCGNGIADGIKFEQCDDGNLIDGDGCDSTCNIETPAWHLQFINGISSRTNGSMAYDIAHDEFVYFGGLDATNTLPADTWIWNRRGWDKATPRTIPPGRQGASMAYDAVHHEIVMFGGIATITSNLAVSETWIWNGHDWRLAVVPTFPGPRSGAGMVFDSKRGRVIMFGGTTNIGAPIPNNETWAWDGATWMKLTPTTSPDPRTDPAMAYDPLRDQIVMFGGSGSTDTWTFDGTNWHMTSPAGPSARSGARMVWDAPTHTSVLFGGSTGAQETWQWNGATWTKPNIALPPAARSDHGFASDATHGVATMFGVSPGGDALTWTWNGTTWTNVTPTPSVPSPVQRVLQTSTDLVNGGSLFTMLGDGTTFRSNGESWTTGAKLGTPRANPGMTYDVAHHQTVLFGGTGATTFGDTWLWNGSAWTNTLATSPGTRTATPLAYDAATATTVMFGGMDLSNTAHSDTWTWDGSAWHQAAPAHVPPPTTNQAMAYDWVAQRVVMFGGLDRTQSAVDLDTTYTWDGSDWSLLAPALAPSNRDSASIGWSPRRHRLVLFGGTNITLAVNAGVSPELWEWDGKNWSVVDAGVGPSARTGGVLFPAFDGSLTLYGGQNEVSLLADVWRLVWENTSLPETCVVPLDLDGDGLSGCDDPDCYTVCNPTCLPGTVCDATQPHCGDGTCDPLETCRMCPGDCGACPAICGDSFCDPGESAASCPGDCH